ncbi:LysR family transcriptional regulator [Vibrio sp. CAU 1672]|uniref:LysR family transcriptional regulator n=1 Tax=Vibrio sp. CAU 1672 TaxID=3032594 RepID=UPI0023DB41B4|nr:LysR family transcriptional regulator [Vibrio sp. CAU 1672]MDF2153502.1 LysR family transcriptional regulator [Vibrio sp. CAU 1672]
MHTLEQLSSFVAVYDTGSYSNAAKMLGKSRATVREQVVSYEDSLGFDLFVIEGKKLIATEKAQALYHRARLLIRLNDELISYSHAFFDQDLINLTVYHDTSVPSDMLVYLEDYLRQRFAHISVNWLHRNRDEALQGLMDKEAQLALLQNRSSIYPEKELEFITLGNLPISVYVGAHSPLLAQQRVPRREIQLHTQYVFENEARANSFFAKASPKTHHVSNPDMLCNLIARDGWGLIPDAIAAPFVKLGLLKKLEVDTLTNSPHIGLSLFYRHGNEEQPAVSYLIDCCRTFAKTYLS